MTEPVKQTAAQVKKTLREFIRPDKAAFLPGFFKAVPGGYGEGDKFLGVVVPDQRKVAKRFRDLSRTQTEKLLCSPWHECRLTGLLILVHQFERACRGRTANEVRAQEIVDYYLDHLDAVNNWDLVDATAPKILGPWIMMDAMRKTIAEKLVLSDVIWHRRMAVVSTYPMIRAGEFDLILKFAKQLISDEHDLIHKSIGWMLREVGKKDRSVLLDFLKSHVGQMPRTMLRYAIEKLPESERKRWLAKQ